MSSHLVRHIETGTCAVAGSLDGYGPDAWEVLGPVPEALAGRPVKEESGAIVADDDGLWLQLRRERDRRLTASDKYMLPDYPISEAKRGEWAAYRQALRDFPELAADPANPEWPEAPE